MKFEDIKLGMVLIDEDGDTLEVASIDKQKMTLYYTSGSSEGDTVSLHRYMESAYIGRLQPIAPTSDLIKRPSHYTSGTIEPIEVIEDWDLPMHLGNALKYIARAGKKEGQPVARDLEKALWFITRYLVKVVGHDYPYKPWED